MRERKGSPEPAPAIRIVASGVRFVVSAGVSFPRDCSDGGSVDAQPSEATDAAPRGGFEACRSRSRAAHNQGPSAVAGIGVWLLWHPAVAERGCRARAVLIHGTPRVVPRSQDPDEHLVHVPLVPASWPAASRAVGGGPAELLAPPTNRLIGDDHATFSQKQFDIPEAKAEHVVQLDRENGGGRAGRARASCLRCRRSPGPMPDPVTVAMPLWRNIQDPLTRAYVS